MTKEVASLDDWIDNSFGQEIETEEETTNTEETSVEETEQNRTKLEVETETEVEVETEAEVEAETEPEISIDKQLSIASKMFGVEFKSEAEVDAFKAKIANLETYQGKVDLIPKLIEKLKSSQNILSYFPDDKAYVAAQLSKQEEYKGKEVVINEVLKSNISELPSLKVIELAAKLDSPNGIRNPFRQKLLSAGLDPEAIAEGYDSLSEDDKDRVDYIAAVERKSLAKLGADIQIPVDSNVDVLAEIEAENSRSKEDLTAKRSTIEPISKALIGELKELSITDGFKFKLEMTAAQRKEYEEFVTEAVLSHEYDLSTEKGKAEMWDAILDLAYINNRKSISTAHEKHIRDEEQHNFRMKSNNAQPINKNEPAPVKVTETKVSGQAAAAMAMVDEYK